MVNFDTTVHKSIKWVFMFDIGTDLSSKAQDISVMQMKQLDLWFVTNSVTLKCINVLWEHMWLMDTSSAIWIHNSPSCSTEVNGTSYLKLLSQVKQLIGLNHVHDKGSMSRAATCDWLHGIALSHTFEVFSTNPAYTRTNCSFTGRSLVTQSDII